MRRTISLLLALACAAPGLAGAARAEAQQQHQHANLYVHWDWGGASGFWNVDQQVRIQRKATASYWAMNWAWEDATTGGYMGLQTNGNRFDGTTGDTAIFSLWDANAADGPSCGEFGGEGTGLSCRLAFPIETDRFYRYRVWRLEADSGGQWWGAWILDVTTGIDHYLGKIRVARDFTAMAPPMNFSEYFGPAVSCDAVPLSVVLWTQPAANSQGDDTRRYEFGSSFANWEHGRCTDGAVTEYDFRVTKGVRASMGAGGYGPLLLVHGIDVQGKSSENPAKWDDLTAAFREWGWDGKVLTLAYYEGDDLSRYGASIDGHGSHRAHFGGAGEHTGKGEDAHDNDTDIRHLAYHWAWYVYDKFTSRGIDVRAIGHSMGGLVMRYAIASVDKGAKGFPPRLFVGGVVTLGTPHGGTRLANSIWSGSDQVGQMGRRSKFVRWLKDNAGYPQATYGTFWVAIGSEDDEALAPNETAIDGAFHPDHRVMYGNEDDVKHEDYRHETSLAEDAHITHETNSTCGRGPASVRGPWPVRWSFLALTGRIAAVPHCG